MADTPGPIEPSGQGGGEFSSEPLVLDVEKATAWLHERWKTNNACPLSGHTEWVITTQAGGLQITAPDGTMILGQAVPVVLLTCQGCGYIMMFDALMMDAMVKPPTEVKHGE